jgi:RecA-family ATPase
VSDGPIHSLQGLLQSINKSGSSQPENSYQKAVQEALGLDPEIVVQRYRRHLDERVRFYLRQRHVPPVFQIKTENGVIATPKQDCSEICFAIAHSLKLAGATPAEAMAVTRQSAYWKDRVRRGKQEKPAKFLSKVFDQSLGSKRAGSDRLISVSPSEWADLPVPVRKWLVRDLMPMKKVTLLYGDGGTGKTLLAMQLAVCVAMELEFLKLPTKTGRVYALLAEDDEDDARITIDAICRHYGVDLRELGQLRLAPRASFDNIVVHFQQNKFETTPLFQQLLIEVKAHGPVLVILDTAADLFGGNENDRAQVRYFISSCCQRIASETGAAVLLCAHPSAEGLRSGKGTAGSTAWSNSARSRLYLYREVADDDADEHDPDFRWLELKKSNLARTGQRIGLRWQNGSFILEVPSEDGASARSRIEQRLVEEVDTAFDNQRPWSAHVQAKGRWLGKWLQKKERMNHRPAQKLIDDLLSRGAIVDVEYDSHRHRSGLCTPQQKEDFLRAKRAR